MAESSYTDCSTAQTPAPASSSSSSSSLSLSFSSVSICIHLVCAIWTSCALLRLLRSLGLPNDGLDLLPIFLVYFLSVLRPHQSGRVGEGRVLEAGPVALYHGGRQDGDDVTGELAKRRVQSKEKNVDHIREGGGGGGRKKIKYINNIFLIVASGSFVAFY